MLTKFYGRLFLRGGGGGGGGGGSADRQLGITQNKELISVYVPFYIFSYLSCMSFPYIVFSYGILESVVGTPLLREL